MFDHLKLPVNINGMLLRNRMVQPAMGTNLNNSDGSVSDALVDFLALRANGGVGLIITEVCTPEPRGRCTPGQLEISTHAFIPGLSRLACAAHAGGAKIALQLAHAGCFASELVTGVQPYSPSGVGTAILPRETPRVMTLNEIGALIKIFGSAARRAVLAGFDAIEIHGGHG